MRWSRRPEFLVDLSVCGLAGMLYCFLTFSNLHLPGPHYDEVFHAAPAVNFYENRYHTEPMQIDPSRVSLFSRPIPLMLMTYVGSVQTFLYLPTFFLFGDSLSVVRGLPIVLGLLALWCVYLFARDLFDRRIGILTLTLLLADAGFVFYVGRDFGPPALPLLCKMGGLYALLLWWRKGRLTPLAVGMFLLGVGVYHKADFLWLITAATISAVVVLWKDLKLRLTRRVLVTILVFFSLGAGPFLLFNIVTVGASFAPLVQAGTELHFLQTIPSALVFRGEQLVHLMSGQASFELFFQGSPLLLHSWFWIVPSIILAAFIGSVAGSLLRISPFPRRRVLGIGLVALLTFLQTAVSPSHGAHHLMASYPFFHLGASLGLATIFHSFTSSPKRFLKYLIPLPAVLAIVAGLMTVWGTHRQLERTGGSGYWSDAIYDLNSYLLEQRRPVAAMDWGFTNNLIVLSKGELAIERVYVETWKQADLRKHLEGSVNDTTFYLFHSQEFTSIPSMFDAFSQTVASQGYLAIVEREFFQRDGKKVYVVYRLERV